MLRKLVFSPIYYPKVLLSYQMIGVNDYHTQGNDLRKGDLVLIGKNVSEVVKTGFCKSGARGNAYTQLELRDIDSGKKRMDRVRTDQNVETFDPRSVEATCTSTDLTGKVIMGKLDGTLTFDLEDEVNGEETVSIPASRLPWPASFYCEDVDEVKLYFYELDEKENFYKLRMSDKVTMEVTKVIRGKALGTVQLENGRIIQVPSHIKEGDAVVIKTQTEEYMGKE